MYSSFYASFKAREEKLGEIFCSDITNKGHDGGMGHKELKSEAKLGPKWPLTTAVLPTLSTQCAPFTTLYNRSFKMTGDGSLLHDSPPILHKLYSLITFMIILFSSNSAPIMTREPFTTQRP